MTANAVVVAVRLGRDRIIADPRPTVRWRTEVTHHPWRQASAELRWNGEVAHIPGAQSVDVAWPFPPLQPGETGELAVRVTGDDGATSPWSEPIPVLSTALPDRWSVPIVRISSADGDDDRPSLLRRSFGVTRPLRRALLRATALGVYQASVNGTSVDADDLKPGWTSYDHRVLVTTTDVTALLRDGENVLGVELAGGWYTEQYGFLGNARRRWHGAPRVGLDLELHFDDGTEQHITTDDEWMGTFDGPRRSSGIYAGEAVDARRAVPGWDQPGFDATGWESVHVEPLEPTAVPQTGPPVRVTGTLPVQAVLKSPDGDPILDFGQNLVGRLRIRVSGPAGAAVRLRHAEVLEQGGLARRTLRYAAAEDTYTLRGDNTGEEWAPAFTFHGFRYAEISGWPGDFDPADVVAEVLHSDMTRTGWFSCDVPDLARLHENVVWGMRGNFLSVPTDCPQRDERLGWTGDLNVFAPTATYLYDSAAFLVSWLRDVAVEQQHNGGVPPHVSPDVLGSMPVPTATWGDVVIVAPWILYERFGDLSALRERMPEMRAYMDTVLSRIGTDGLWTGDFQFADWLDPASPPEDPAAGSTNADLVANAVTLHSLTIMIDAATVLGDDDDADRWAYAREQLQQAFLAEFVTANGRLVSDSQTAYAMTVAWDLARTDAERIDMGRRLRDLLRRSGYLIGTGFVGTPILTEALSLAGFHDAAGLLITQRECPSWLYQVGMGATTMWERWDSMLPDGSINPGEMTSFNHYALGAVADWLHRRIGGLSTLEPGYQVVLIAPQPIAAVHEAKTTHDSAYGRTTVRWQRADGALTVRAVVPANTTALVRLPGVGHDQTVGSGEHTWVVPDPIADTTAALHPDVDLATIADDREAFDLVRRIVRAHASEAPAATEKFLVATRWETSGTLAGALRLFPPTVVTAVLDAITDLERQRR